MVSFNFWICLRAKHRRRKRAEQMPCSDSVIKQKSSISIICTVISWEVNDMRPAMHWDLSSVQSKVKEQQNSTFPTFHKSVAVRVFERKIDQ